MIDINDATSKLKTFMASKNLPYNRDEFYMDGRIHRYSAKRNGNKDEYYSCQIIEGNHFRCMFGSWGGNQPRHFWNSFDKNEIPDFDEKIEAINKQFEIEREIKQKKTQEEFIRFWNDLEPGNNHPYLTKKQIKAHDVKKRDNFLYVPYYSYDKAVSTCVRIDKDGNKRNYTGLSTKLLFHPFGSLENAKEIIFCEGYATAASIYECTKITTISCGNCHNVAMVAQIFSNQYPESKLSYAMDNGEAGEKVKTEWTTYFNKNVYTPSHNESDFNDVFCKYGKEEVIKLFKKKSLNPMGILSMINLEIKEPEKINDILNTGDIDVLYAGPKVGKSRFAYELAICSALGIQFLKIKNYKKIKVLYIDGELPDYEIKKRCSDIMKRQCKAHPDLSITDEDIKFIRYKDFKEILGDKMNLSLKEHQEQVEEIIKPYDLLIFDSLGCVTAKRDTDSYVAHELDWRAFFYWLRDLKEKYQKTSLIIMHQIKAGDLEGTQKIKNDCDNFFQLKTPVDKKTGAATHFQFLYKECRSIPLDEQRNFEAQYYKHADRLIKTAGWSYDYL